MITLKTFMCTTQISITLYIHKFKHVYTIFIDSMLIYEEKLTRMLHT